MEVKQQFTFVEVKNIIFEGSKSNMGYVIFMLLLSFLNWASESERWRLCFTKEVSFKSAFKATLVGLGVSTFLPRIAGESIGRIWKLKPNRLQVVSTLALTKVIMAMVTFAFGILGLCYFKATSLFDWGRLGVIALVLTIVIGCLYVFTQKNIIPFLREQKFSKALFHLEYTQVLKVVAWSVFRYFTFLIQTILVFRFLGIEFQIFDLLMGLAVLYLFRMGTISLNIFIDLGLRFGTAIFIFQRFGVIDNVNQILAIFTCVWLVNVILPTICGGVLISIDRK